MELLVVVVILLLVFGGGWAYTGRPGYAGPRYGGILGVLLVVIVIVLAVRLLGVL